MPLIQRSTASLLFLAAVVTFSAILSADQAVPARAQGCGNTAFQVQSYSSDVVRGQHVSVRLSTNTADRARFTFGGKEVNDDSAPYTARFDTAGLRAGSYPLRITVSSNCGGQTKREGVRVFDPPSVPKFDVAAIKSPDRLVGFATRGLLPEAKLRARYPTEAGPRYFDLKLVAKGNGERQYEINGGSGIAYGDLARLQVSAQVRDRRHGVAVLGRLQDYEVENKELKLFSNQCTRPGSFWFTVSCNTI